MGWIYFVDENDENIFWIPLDKDISVVKLIVNHKKVWAVLSKVFKVKKMESFLRNWFINFNERFGRAIRYFESSKRYLFENITKFIVSESKDLLKMKRRIGEIDNYVDSWLNNNRLNLKGWETADDWLEFIGHDIAETLYYDYFGDIDDNSKEWGEIYDFIRKYIIANHSDKIKKRYEELKK